MKPYWIKIRDQLDARTKREKLIILVMAIVVIFLIWNFLFDRSLRQKNQVLSNQAQVMSGKARDCKNKLTLC